MYQAFQLRPDFDRIRAARAESRSPERLDAHFQVERRLAETLAGASQADRTALYPDLYRQLFESVPDHPQHSGRRDVRLQRIERQKTTLLRDLTADATYVEIGCGDAALTKAIAPHVRAAIGVDVTDMLVADLPPPGFRFVKTNGIELDLDANCTDLVFSNQLMEHLHADDAVAQLREIHRVLKPGGRYICHTPNRLTGPHDISLYFGYEPRGFHMREYDHRSLAALFRFVGFSTVVAEISLKGRSLRVPIGIAGLAERAFEALPRGVRLRLALRSLVMNLAGVVLVGTK